MVNISIAMLSARREILTGHDLATTAPLKHKSSGTTKHTAQATTVG
jgi:hypothetical protein